MPSPRPSSVGQASSRPAAGAACPRRRRAGRCGCRVPPVASWSNTPSTTAPWPTIGAFGRRGTAGRAGRPAASVWSTSASTRPISSFMLPRRSHAIALSQASESTGGPVLRPVVEPAEPQQGVLDGELARAALVEVGVHAVGVRLERLRGSRGSISASSRSATRRQPIVRITWSVSRVSSPNSSESRPAVTCRRRSISQNAPGPARSPARASGRRSSRRRSAGCRARRGPPSTGPAGPGTSSSPEVCGRGRRTTATPATAHDENQDQPDGDVHRPGPVAGQERSAPATSVRTGGLGRRRGCRGAGGGHGVAIVPYALAVKTGRVPAPGPARAASRMTPCPPTSTPAPSAGTGSRRCRASTRTP